MRELTAALALNTTVTHLRLRSCGLVAADVYELAGALERNRTVKTLDVTCNKIGAAGACHLAAALGRTGRLQCAARARPTWHTTPSGARELGTWLRHWSGTPRSRPSTVPGTVSGTKVLVTWLLR
jgi:hypothetical protein